MLTADQEIETAEPTNIVIFGVTGDLSKRKLMPALVRMLCCGLVHDDSKIIGIVNNRTEEVWLKLVREGMQEFLPEVVEDENRWKKFLSRLIMVPGDLGDETTYQRLAEALVMLDGKKMPCSIVLFPLTGMVKSHRGCIKWGLDRKSVV